MNQFTSDIVQALVQKQDITEVFRTHLEQAVNTLLVTELTAFLDYENMTALVLTQVTHATVLIHARCTQNMVIYRSKFYVIAAGNLNNRRLHRINVQMIRLNHLLFTCFKRV